MQSSVKLLKKAPKKNYRGPPRPKQRGKILLFEEISFYEPSGTGGDSKINSFLPLPLFGAFLRFIAVLVLK